MHLCTRNALGGSFILFDYFMGIFFYLISLWVYFSIVNIDFPPKPLLQIFPCKNSSKIMIITSHMQNIIQINPCLLKLSRKQDTIGFGGKSIFTSEVYTVFKVEYFLYIIQIMLQYTPSFNIVCYTLRLQGCFL
jgi:hypothetical protein